jgi:hypothetical protein
MLVDHIFHYSSMKSIVEMIIDIIEVQDINSFYKVSFSPYILNRRKSLINGRAIVKSHSKSHIFWRDWLFLTSGPIMILTELKP